MAIECEACGHPLEGGPCAKCNKDVPNWAKFCPFCGEKVAVVTFSKSDDPFAMENRILCSDDNCIGVMGRDGRCTECGKRG